MNKRSEQQILKIMSDMGITEEHLRQLVGEFFIQEDVWNNEKEEKLIYYDAPLEWRECMQIWSLILM